MYQNLLAKEVIKDKWLTAMGYIDAQGEADEAALFEGERHFENWYATMEPLVQAINVLQEKLDHVNNGCKLHQKQFKEELAKCLKIQPEEETK